MIGEEGVELVTGGGIDTNPEGTNIGEMKKNTGSTGRGTGIEIEKGSGIGTETGREEKSIEIGETVTGNLREKRKIKVHNISNRKIKLLLLADSVSFLERRSSRSKPEDGRSREQSKRGRDKEDRGHMNGEEHNDKHQ